MNGTQKEKEEWKTDGGCLFGGCQRKGLLSQDGWVTVHEMCQGPEVFLVQQGNRDLGLLKKRKRLSQIMQSKT
jgi:hypothetical protein